MSDDGNRPGQWVSAPARPESRLVWALVGSAIVGGLAIAVAALALPLLLSVVILAAGWPLCVVGGRHGNLAGRWLRGSAPDVTAGGELVALAADGFLVLHDIPQTGEGSVDHLVCGPTGVYLVETRHRTYLPEHGVAPKRQAANIGRELGVPVTPVVCVDRVPEPYRDQRVSVVGRANVRAWIRAQDNPPARPERMAAFAGRIGLIATVMSEPGPRRGTAEAARRGAPRGGPHRGRSADGS